MQARFDYGLTFGGTMAGDSETEGAGPAGATTTRSTRSPRQARRQLEKFFLDSFESKELRIFLRGVDPAIVDALPGGEAAPASLAHEAVETLARLGLITEEFFRRLRQERWARVAEIDAIWKAMSAVDVALRVQGPREAQAVELLAEIERARAHHRDLVQRGVTGRELRTALADLRSLREDLLGGLPFVQGEILGDRYLLIERRGEGGLAEVWEAEDQQHGGRVALRILHQRFAVGGDSFDSYVAGVEAHALVSQGPNAHPNVVRMLDTRFHARKPIIEDRICFHVLELLEGPTLETALAAEPPMPFVRALEALIRIAEALEHVHERGIIHRDVKPANIVLAGDRPVLIDFDLAYDIENINQTRLAGSFMFAAPEMSMRGVEPDVRADVYSLGATLLKAWSPQATMIDVVRVYTGNGPDHPELGAILRRSVAWQRDDRFPTMTAMREALVDLARTLATDEGNRVAEARELVATDPAAAARALDAVLEANPEAADALLERGLLRLQEGSLERALDCFREVERLCGKDTSPQLRIASALAARSLDDHAEPRFRWVASLEPDGEAAAWLDYFNARRFLPAGRGDVPTDDELRQHLAGRVSSHRSGDP